jgi:hypothetical protein
VITKEILHHFNNRWARKGAMAWKIDFEKAYIGLYFFPWNGKAFFPGAVCLT